MLLTTKYNINDIVFYFDSNTLKVTTIRQIIVEEYDYHLYQNEDIDILVNKALANC